MPSPTNVVYPQITTGISRNLWRGNFGDLVLTVQGSDVAPGETAGGDLNGSANTAHLMGQAGTACVRIALPRKPPNSGNYCGVI